jgi:hypothetical protein
MKKCDLVISFMLIVSMLLGSISIVGAREPRAELMPGTAMQDALQTTEAVPVTEPSIHSEPIPIPQPREITYKGHRFVEGETITGELTHYCAGSCCNGKWAGGTADGTVLDSDTESTVAINWLPFGAIVEIEGVQYTVHDRGGPGLDPIGRVDIYVPEGHQTALDRGRIHNVSLKVVSLP